MHNLKLLGKVAAFSQKVQLWIKEINGDSYNKIIVSQNLLPLFKTYFSKLTNSFAKYFEGDNVEMFAWIEIISMLKLYWNSLSKKKRVQLNSLTIIM